MRRRSAWILGFLLLMAPAGALAQISFVGTQTVVPGVALEQPYGVVTDAAGNLYVSDPALHEIACYTTANAACGAPFPITAGLSQPKGMAIDPRGNLYVADAGLGALLEIAKTQSGYAAPVTLVDGLNDPEAVAQDAGGNLFVAVAGSGEILELPIEGAQYGPPGIALSGLSQPVGIVFDPYRTMYISEAGVSEIVISSLTAGGYRAPAYYAYLPGMGSQPGVPGSLSIDPSGLFYATDQTTHQIVQYRMYYSVGRPAFNAYIGSGLQTPGQVAFNASGTAMIADAGLASVVEVAAQNLPFPSEPIGTQAAPNAYILSVAAGTTIGAIQVNPMGLAHPDFERGPADTCVTGTYATTTICTVQILFTPTGSGARSGAFVVEDANGMAIYTQYLAGSGVASRLVTLPSGEATVLGGLPMPVGVAVDLKGNLYVSDGETYTVNEYSQAASGFAAAQTLPVSDVNTPAGLATDAAGNLLIASSGNDRVIRYEWNGQAFSGQENVGEALYVPSAVGVSPNGAMCIANTYENQVNCYNWAGQAYVPQPRGVNFALDGTFATHFPVSVQTDAEGNVYWVDPYQNAVVDYIKSRQLYVALWNGYFQHPTAMALDAEDDVYVLDAGHDQVVMMVPQNGIYQKPIVVASGFNAAEGLAVDAAGNLYVADTGNHRVVKITMSQAAPLSFAPTSAGKASAAQSVELLSVGAASATITAISYPQDFQPAASATGVTTACSVGLQLQQGQSCAVSVIFAPSAANAQFSESITVTAMSSSGQALAYTVPVQGSSANLLAQTISFPSQSPVVYGQQMVNGDTSFPLNATASSRLPVSYSVVSGPGVVSGNLLEALGAGTIVVQATQAGNGIYAAAAPVEQTFLVLPATLTVTATSQQIVYGGSSSSFAYTITGFVGGDSAASVVSGNPVITCNAGAHPAAGSYPIQISAGTLAAANYTFAFVAGSLTVSPAVLQVTATSLTSAYGQALPTFGFSISGFVNGDSSASVRGQPIFMTAATSTSGVGTYPLTMAQGSMTAANYNFQFVPGTITMTPGTLTVAATNMNISYGSAVPALSYTISGFSNGDQAAQAVSGAAAVSTNYAPGAGTGSYAISVAAGTLVARNYRFVFQPGTLTVSQASLYLVPDGQVMQMGQPVPALSYHAVGLMGSDTLATATTGTPSLNTEATPQSLPGYYPILAAQGTMTAKNYVIVPQTGLLQVIWSGNGHVNPPGVFAPPPVRLRGDPVLPLTTVAAQARLPGVGTTMPMVGGRFLPVAAPASDWNAAPGANDAAPTAPAAAASPGTAWTPTEGSGTAGADGCAANDGPPAPPGSAQQTPGLSGPAQSDSAQPSPAQPGPAQRTVQPGGAADLPSGAGSVAAPGWRRPDRYCGADTPAAMDSR